MVVTVLARPTIGTCRPSCRAPGDQHSNGPTSHRLDASSRGPFGAIVSADQAAAWLRLPSQTPPKEGCVETTPTPQRLPRLVGLLLREVDEREVQPVGLGAAAPGDCDERGHGLASSSSRSAWQDWSSGHQQARSCPPDLVAVPPRRSLRHAAGRAAGTRPARTSSPGMGWRRGICAGRVLVARHTPRRQVPGRGTGRR